MACVLLPWRRRACPRVRVHPGVVAPEAVDAANCFDTSDECTVCYAGAADAWLRRTVCDHVVCMACAERWNEKRATCPVCRAPLLLHPSARDVATHVLALGGDDERKHVGVTLSATFAGDAVVTSTDKADVAAHAGVRRGDVLVRTNGLPCRDHASTSAALTLASEQGVTVRCLVRRRGQRVRIVW